MKIIRYRVPTHFDTYFEIESDGSILFYSELTYMTHLTVDSITYI
jgi:hypothetical protein